MVWRDAAGELATVPNLDATFSSLQSWTHMGRTTKKQLLIQHGALITNSYDISLFPIRLSLVSSQTEPRLVSRLWVNIEWLLVVMLDIPKRAQPVIVN